MYNKAVLTLIYIYIIRVYVAHSQSGILMYTSPVKLCSPDMFINKNIIQHDKNSRGKIECMSRCTRDVQCKLATYQEFQDGPASCTKLTGVQYNNSTTLDVATSINCVVMFVSSSLNGGQGNSSCHNGFTGENCDQTVSSVCSVEWIEVATSTAKGNTVWYPDVVKEFGRTNTKVRFEDKNLKLVTVMKGMKGDRDESYDPIYWSFVTFPFFEKVAWNKFALNPQRQFLNILFGGKYQLLSFDRKNYSFYNSTMEFSFITPKQTRFITKRTLPEDFQETIEDLNNGHPIYRSTLVKEEERVIVAQLADRFVNTYIVGHFVDPPKMLDYKYVLGVHTHISVTLMGEGITSDLNKGTARKAVYMNPCWTRMRDDASESFIDWEILENYLTLGNDVRVKVGSIYHTVLEVIQTGDSFHFVLAPFLSQDGSSKFTSPLYGVRSLLSSSAIYQSCRHQIEGEDKFSWSYTMSQYNVVWFADTRKWNKVFAVFSNSSVLHGSVDELISGVTKGYDVRIWIKWLNSDISRFLDTHMSSVTSDGKVSTESIITWRATTVGTILLSSNCDLEYVLVTSEGLVEILTFNLWTPGKSTVHSDVMITWFLA